MSDELTRLRLEALRRQERARAALAARGGGQAQTAQPEVIQEVGEGVIVQMPDGTRAFQGQGYSTTDPTEVDLISQGLPVGQAIERARGRKAIQEQPVASRVVTAAQGLPFVGEYAEEAGGALLGPETREVTRATQATMAAEKPIETGALQMAGGVIGAAPLAAATGLAAPLAAASRFIPAAQRAIQGLPMAGQIGAAAGLGAIGGAIEGAVSGFGRGVGGAEERAPVAGQGAAAGAAFGGALQAVSPVVGAGFRNLVAYARNRPVSDLAKYLGVSNDTAKVVMAALSDNDIPAARAALARGGSRSMLADASDEARALLDAAITFGTETSSARKAVEARNLAAYVQASETLNRIFGPPEDIDAIQSAIRGKTATARDEAYRAAYATPINYASAAGRQLEEWQRFIPASVLRKANELISLDPRAGPSRQILFDVADDGTVTYRRLPDMRQWDYITRGMSEIGYAREGGAMGGPSAVQRLMRDNSRQIRAILREMSPDYDRALGVAGGTIEEVEASRLGYDLLQPGTRVAEIVQSLTGAPKAERDAMKQGVRAFLDHTLGNLRVAASNPNNDIKEIQTMISMVSSRNNRAKLAALLGEAGADDFYKTVDEHVNGLIVLNAIARNSATAGRQGVLGRVRETTAPGILGLLAQGKVVPVTERLVQVMTGQTPEMQAAREAGIFNEIAALLVNAKGDGAQDAYKMVMQAKAGRALNEAQARIIAGQVARRINLRVGAREAATGQTMPVSPAQMRQK